MRSLLLLLALTFSALADPAAAPPKPSAISAAPPLDLTLDLGNNVSLKLVLIPAGKFIMGSPDTEPYRVVNEGPQHEVTISRPFYFGIYPVTQEQYVAVMGSNPTKNEHCGTEPTCPVQPMTYDDITSFCQKLSEKSGRTVRLNTEAEWEYAARAGTTTTWFFGEDHKVCDDYGWFMTKITHPVGQKKPNPWGLYDIYGNCGEVCSDWGGHYPKGTDASYTADPVTDPTGPATGEQHIARGQAGWIGNVRSAGHRGAYAHPEYGDHLFGFRIVVEVPK